MKRILSVFLILAVLFGVSAMGASALGTGQAAATVEAAGYPPPPSTDGTTIGQDTWNNFWYNAKVGFHWFVTHILFGWIWLKWFGLNWY